MSTKINYPIVVIPSIICQWLEREKIASSKPTTKKRKYSRNKVYFLGFVSGILIVLLINFLVSLEWNLTALITFLIALSGSFLSAFFFLRLFDFPQEFGDDERAIALITSLRKRYAKRSKAQKIKRLLSGNVKPLEPITPSATQGLSEKYFLDRLKEYFSEEVNFPDGVFSIPGDFYEYTPDILYHDPSTGLTIDIEIDEPYVGDTKEPHHCIDEDKDSNRDEFFLKKNWVVVRFAEEQVVKYPVACAYYLDRLIYRLTDVSHNVPVTKLKSIPRWDLTSAKELANQNFRLGYLEENGLWQSQRFVN